MANADDAIKQQADYVTLSNDENGVAIPSTASVSAERTVGLVVDFIENIQTINRNS